MIKSVNTGSAFYLDSSILDEVKANFKSEVYDCLEEYLADIDIRARNEHFRGELPFVTESTKPRRSPKERTAILVQKIEAQRRLDRHVETGGTEISIGKWPDIFDVKKASH
ncbi:hypothetical protein [Vibrio vulnificus]|uniref:hypothetical protein n=1 Tax=Vibrio vulnificus TaxID=672 RepID=UPI00102D265D|nr:hypothetical protein [Vibrio vulnificus]MCU8269331.1 hypothetical protein [Vibrio vulnificus]RZR41749.1 hypothetical protein D8T58_20475 [Vibrio vulnificus]